MQYFTLLDLLSPLHAISAFPSKHGSLWYMSTPPLSTLTLLATSPADPAGASPWLLRLLLLLHRLVLLLLVLIAVVMVVVVQVLLLLLLLLHLRTCSCLGTGQAVAALAQ